MVELTKAEEQMMQYLWKLGEGTVQEVMASMEEKKRPSRTTVSTVIRLLEEKGLVGHKPTTGRGYIYYPLLKKEEYSHHYLKNFIKRYFIINSFSSSEIPMILYSVISVSGSLNFSCFFG